MKNILAIVLICLYGTFSVANAQELALAGNVSLKSEISETKENKKTYKFTAFSQDEAIKNIAPELAGEHFLGDNIARKMYLFSNQYVSKTAISPGNPTTQTQIRKPMVYNAVKKLERHYKKGIKAGTIGVEAASKEFNTVLEVALSIAEEETTDLEKEINSKAEPEYLLELFLNRIKLNYIQ